MSLKGLPLACWPRQGETMLGSASLTTRHVQLVWNAAYVPRGSSASTLRDASKLTTAVSSTSPRGPVMRAVTGLAAAVSTTRAVALAADPVICTARANISINK